jgi:uncharacterized MAPEG superfamily protein
MTRMTSARIAGFTFLFYIAVAFPSVILMGRATTGDDVAAQLASVAQHAMDVRIAIVLTLLSCFSAVVLAVTLYGITRDVDHELAILILVSRLAEGALGVIGIPDVRALLWLASPGAGAPDSATLNALGTFLLMPARSAMLGAPFFAVGSLAFTYLLLRGRLVPGWLAWVGVFASALLVVVLPLQIAGFSLGLLAALMWLPMLAFEVPLGIWLMVKGVPARGAR